MLAVTTLAPFSRAARISDRAGSMPPITSTTTSTSSRATRPAASVVSSPVGHLDLARRVEPAYGDADQLDRRADPGLEVAGLLLQEADHLRADRAAAEHGHLHTHSLAHPCPSPTGRPQSRVAGAPAPFRPARRPPAGAARGCSWRPSSGSRRRCRAPPPGRRARCRRAGTRRGRRCRRPRSACRPPGDSTGGAVGRAVGDRAGVVGVVERGADVVAHPAVDRDVGADRAAVERDRLDRADGVDGAGRRADDRAARARSTAAAARSRAPCTRARRSW